MNLLRNTINYFYQNIPRLFYITFFLIRIPPVYLPFSILKLLTIHILYRILLALLFLVIILKKNNPLIKPTPIVLLFFIFFIVQSLSVISATNLVVFISQYEKLVVSGIFFLVAIAVSKIDKVNFKKSILKVFIMATCCILLLELII